MKHIETSKLVVLPHSVETAVIKKSLVERMRGAFHVETVGEGVESFSLAMMAKEIPCRCVLDVLVKTDGARARIMISGKVALNSSAKVFYALGILALLVLGLFPGLISTSGSGGALDFLVFLFLGIFILYDTHKKQAEAEILLDRILSSVQTEFGV